MKESCGSKAEGMESDLIVGKAVFFEWSEISDQLPPPFCLHFNVCFPGKPGLVGYPSVFIIQFFNL